MNPGKLLLPFHAFPVKRVLPHLQEPKRPRTNLPATCSRATLPMRHSALTLMRYGSILPITVTLPTPI